MMTDRWPLESLVGAIRALLDELEGRFRIDVALRGTVSCTLGCANCCHWPVAASPMEGLIVLDHLIRNRMWTKSLQVAVEASADQVTGLSYHVWRGSNIPCPLLRESNDVLRNPRGAAQHLQQCSVWEARPMACRLAASRGDPDECHPHRIATAAHLIPFAPQLIEFRQREAALLRSQDIKVHTLPLATAILVAARVKEAGLDMMPHLTLNEYFRRAM